MKTCPKCGELLGDTIKVCFKCRYSYTYGRVITGDEHASQRNRQMEERKRKEEENKLRDEMKKEQLSKNSLFEYKAVVIDDLPNGQVDGGRIQISLDEWSEKGWRLHSVYSSEIGKNSTSVSIAGFGTITNATIDQTVLIFERCIKA